MIAGINESTTLKSIHHANVNVNSMKKKLSQISGGIMTNVDVSVKNVMYVKKIIFGILLYVAVKM